MAAVGVIDIVGRFAYLCCSLVWDDSYTSPIATVDRRAELMGVTTGITFICDELGNEATTKFQTIHASY